MRIFLCGDVMLGRGVDQALADPCKPQIHEAYLHSARDYLRLAERANGPIAVPLTPSYIWGAALEEFDRLRPCARIVNLETSITRSEEFLPKGINYRVSPENARCLAVAGIDCCVLANNHVLDWGRAGLTDTLGVLDALGIRHSGAGRDDSAAELPAVVACGEHNRVLVFSAACGSAGVPPEWAATPSRPGVNRLPDLSQATASAFGDQVARNRQDGDVVVVSIHWGANWGHAIGDEQRRFAHGLIDRAGVSIVHGHSSHHAKAIEVHAGRLILYGCGDFLNDYEGIAGYEEYRGDLAVMYFPEVDPATGRLVGLDMTPLQIRRLRLNQARPADVDWLGQTLDRESRKLGARITWTDQRLRLDR
jgi:poly-gamma-glutamate capsule biosynthesis protein CapA/YwtB (metallophosphatase superfamily)